MTKFLVAAAILIAAIFGWIAISKGKAGENTIRLKATATILVDGVPRTGSSVQEFFIQWNYQPQLSSTGAWRILSRGEAIRIDVPDGEPVYVLMSTSSDDGNYGAFIQSQCTVRDKGPEVHLKSFLELQECSSKAFPKAVRLSPDNHPDKAVPVYTGGGNRNGYKFQSMKFKRTDEPLTEGTIPTDIWQNDRKVIKAFYENKISIIGEYSFKTDEFQ